MIEGIVVHCKRPTNAFYYELYFWFDSWGQVSHLLNSKFPYEMGWGRTNQGRRWKPTKDEVKKHLGKNKCDLCGVKSSHLYFDHNHETKKARGMLCLKCNVGLGQLAWFKRIGLERIEKYLA